jgi:hypothetical protein
VFAAQANNSLQFTLLFVQRVCEEANAPSELVRVAAALNPHTAPTTNVPTARGMATREARKLTRERRVVAAWFMSLAATSERLTVLREPMDTIANNTEEEQALVAGTGVGQSFSSVKRKRRRTKREYQTRFSNELARQSGWTPGAKGGKVLLFYLLLFLFIIIYSIYYYYYFIIIFIFIFLFLFFYLLLFIFIIILFIIILFSFLLLFIILFYY